MRQQQGAALLSAMIVVVLVMTLAATALWQQWRNIEIESAERTRAQAAWILNGALDWGRLILAGDLREDEKKNQRIDHLGEPWAVPLAEARLSTFLAAGQDSGSDRMQRDAFMAGQMTDMQSRLNLLNLTADDETQRMAAQTSLQRLFDLLDLPDSELQILLRRIPQAARAMQQSRVTQADIPLLPRQLQQLSWLGLQAASIDRLQDHLSLLPLTAGQATAININTASAEVIYAALDGLDLAQARQLVQQRQRHFFKNPQQVREQLDMTELDLSQIAVASSFFEILGQLRLDDVVLQEKALVYRRSDPRRREVMTLWRERTPLGAKIEGQALDSLIQSP